MIIECLTCSQLGCKQPFNPDLPPWARVASWETLALYHVEDAAHLWAIAQMRMGEGRNFIVETSRGGILRITTAVDTDFVWGIYNGFLKAAPRHRVVINGQEWSE